MEVIEKELEKIPIIGNIFKGLFNCFQLKIFIASLIPLLALKFKSDENDLLNTVKLIIIFYIFSIIGGIIIQYWNCKNNNKNFIDKLKTSMKETWFIPLMFTIFTVINFILQQPFLIEFREITFIFTFFIQITFILGIIMYFISFQNYCALEVLEC